jgi:circadian clock protein KaiC
MRELIFSDSGVTLTDPYTAGGKVLMGTLRIEKENAVRVERERKHYEIEQKRQELELAMGKRDMRLDAAQQDLRSRLEELGALTHEETTHTEETTHRHDEFVRRRDSELVHAQPDGGKSLSGKPRSRVKRAKIRK